VQQENFDLSLKEKEVPSGANYYFGHGKVLLTGEYTILEGAKAIALPTKPGQSMKVTYQRSYDPKLYWKSIDLSGKSWFECTFEFWNFDIVSDHKTKEALFLQRLLREIRAQNTHFLREEQDIHVETFLGFPREWGLGSSSTLIYNLAQWGYVSPFELLYKTSMGSGYDVACAQSEGPILFKKESEGPIYSPVIFDPPFKENLYFIYLGKKQNTEEEIIKFKNLAKKDTKEVTSKVSLITDKILACNSLEEFSHLISEHEKIMSSFLGKKTLKEKHFIDFRGEVKSLGAWGGDFALACSTDSKEKVKNYFDKKGFSVCLDYSDLILENNFLNSEMSERVLH
ncbi:MAG: hypothetical protein CME61_06520, partial [Halobacteriovoraceae bacterium]|nr:hypothetical protein [Halobacteriovoraceae bacterium]